MRSDEEAVPDRRDPVSVKLERFYRQRRMSGLLLKAFGGACVVLLSFWVSLALIDAMHSDDTAATEEVRVALAKGVTTSGGLRVYSSASPSSAQTAADSAFAGARTSSRFWEAHDFPVDLIVLLPEPRKLAKYAISSGELADRMPKSWTLKGSADGQSWVDLDGQKGVPKWSRDERRSYDMREAKPVQVLRFRFQAGFDPNILRIYEIELG